MPVLMTREGFKFARQINVIPKYLKMSTSSILRLLYIKGSVLLIELNIITYSYWHYSLSSYPSNIHSVIYIQFVL